MLAQRMGAVFASPSTWAKMVKERRWRRPRGRVHPAKPKVGIRAYRPNELWYIDTSVFRMLDGTKAYVQGVIDNYSRRILAIRVSPRLEPASTAALLLKAVDDMDEPKTTTMSVMVDAGVEDFQFRGESAGG